MCRRQANRCQTQRVMSEAQVAACWEAHLLVSYGLEACGVCSLGSSVVWHRRLCAASCPSQYHQLPAQQDAELFTKEFALEGLQQSLRCNTLASILSPTRRSCICPYGPPNARYDLWQCSSPCFSLRCPFLSVHIGNPDRQLCHCQVVQRTNTLEQALNLGAGSVQ